MSFDCCFSLHFFSFSIAGISPNDSFHWFASSGCILSLGVCYSSSLFVVFFAPTSVPLPPVCLALFCVALWFFGASDSLGSPVPVATWSPFRTSQGCFSLCSLGFEMPTCGGIHSVFVSAPFLCLVRILSSLSDMFAS